MVFPRNQSLSMLRKLYFPRMVSIRNLSYSIEKPKTRVYQRTGSFSMDRNIRVASLFTPSSIKNQDEIRRQLEAVWPDVVRDIEAASQNLPGLFEQLIKMLEYNVLDEMYTFSLNSLQAYHMLVPTDQKTKENLYLARILAWCIELMKGCLIVHDDILDNSLIRNNHVCWHKHDGVGLTAVNDGILLESLTYKLMQKHFKQRDCYLDLLETFHDTSMLTWMGRSLEFIHVSHNVDLSLFTEDLYEKIVYHKLGYSAFVFPTKVAMIFAGMKDQELHKEATEILLKLGYLYQVQDDYMDCYGDHDNPGNIETDIEEGKCTWLAVMALQRATQEQWNIFRECYGSTDMEKKKWVKQLYDDLQMPKIFSAYEKETCHQLNHHIDQLSCDLPKEHFRNILNYLSCRLRK